MRNLTKLCLLCCFFSFAQNKTNLIQNQSLPLRKQVKALPEAKKTYRQYQIKAIGGAVVSTAGVVLLNHSIGRISPRKSYQWEQSLVAASIVGTGLLITKGAKQKRKKAIEIVHKKKKMTLSLQGNSLKIFF